MAKRAYPLAKAKLEATSGTPEPPSQPTAAPASAAAWPAAPVSVNVHVTIAGRQVQVTLRDSDETRLLAWLEVLLAQFPAEADRQQEHPEMCYTSRAIRHEQVGRWRVKQSLEIWLCQSETCT